MARGQAIADLEQEEARNSSRMGARTMSAAIEILLKRNLREVFGERDSTKRRSAIAQIWANNGVFVDAHGRHVGHSEIDAAASALQKRLPDHVFTETGAP